MSLAIWFWILMAIWLVFGLWSNWPMNQGNAKVTVGSGFLFVLLLLIGWKIFGAPIHD